MASVQDLQSLIADIDTCINQAVYPLPWLSQSLIAKQRLLLVKARSHFDALLVEAATSNQDEVTLTTIEQETATVIAQEVIRQMSNLSEDSPESLPDQLESLRHQRDTLQQEIKQLQQQRQKIMGEFLPAMTSRWSETLTREISQIKSNLDTEFPTTADGSNQLADNNQQLQQLQQQFQQLLTNLDTTVQSVLGNVERDLLTYQESLSQGLAQMHHLGQQGEVRFAALVNRLSEQLALIGAQNPEGEIEPNEQFLTAVEVSQIEPREMIPSTENFPFAGMEVADSNQDTISVEEEVALEEETIISLWQLQINEQDLQILPPSVIPLQIGENGKNPNSQVADLTVVATSDTSPHQEDPHPTAQTNPFTELGNSEIGQKTSLQIDSLRVEIDKSGKEMPPEGEVITKLTDLLGKGYFTAQEEENQESMQDEYTPPSPKEDLLAMEELKPDWEQQPWLDPNQEKNLDEDLNNFGSSPNSNN